METNGTETSDSNDAPAAPVTELSKPARRALGVLVEKAFTTPEYYPMTLKAVTAGCNQKSNRSPVFNYLEDEVYDALGALREMGLVAVVHTESGRTERFRHYMRKRFTFSEPQLAVMTELLLRGRQQLGELRSRASRMVSIDSLDQLRSELTGLQSLNMIQTSGPLTRRGAEVDHNLYREKEGMTIAAAPAAEVSQSKALETSSRPAKTDSSHPSDEPNIAPERIAALEARIEQLLIDNNQFRSDLESVREEFQRLSDRFDQLQSDLGG